MLFISMWMNIKLQACIIGGHKGYEIKEADIVCQSSNKY